MEENKNYQLCIPSFKRYKNVSEMETLLGTTDILWAFNSEEDAQEYLKLSPNIRYVIGGSLCKNRNSLLKHCLDRNIVCAMIDDDLVRTTNNTNFLDKGEAKPLEVIEELINDLETRPETMAGSAPTSNDYFAKKEVQQDKFVCSFMIFKPTGILFDEEIPLKEDYEMCANHIKNGGGVIRYNKYMFHFKRYTNAGGCQDIRDDEGSAEAESVDYLMNKYPGFFKLNTKRDNEVLMNRGIREKLLRDKSQTTLF